MTAPTGPIEKLSAKRVVTGQYVCTECGTPFIATQASKTCTPACRMKRVRRRGKGDKREWFTDFSDVTKAMEKAAANAVDDLPKVAREVLAEELRPAIREAMTGQVLQSIGDMVRDLLPLALLALKDDLTAMTPMFDDEGAPLLGPNGEHIHLPDYDRRQRATTLVTRYTIGQPGLAPQPEAPEQAPITVIFPSMPAPTAHVEAEASEVFELVEGQRVCDICDTAKPADEFVGASSRCQPCHDAHRARIDAAIAARTK